MPPKVKNIVVDELNFHKEIDRKDKALLYAAQFLPKGVDAKDLLPKTSKYTVRFELHDTCESFANAIRRTLIADMPILSLDYDEIESEITDPFILNDAIKKQIHLIPIAQEIPNFEKYTFNLTKINKTDDLIDVYSDDIVCEPASKKKLVNAGIIITRLRPGEKIKIPNIKIVQGIPSDDQARFNSFSNTSYKILDARPFSHETGKGQSSLVSDYKIFQIGYSTHRNIDKPLHCIQTCCDILVEKLERLKIGLSAPDKEDSLVKEPYVVINDNKGTMNIKIYGENYTITNIVAKYCYLVTDKNIKYINAGIVHPQTKIGIINIIHAEWKQVLNDAIDQIISDLKGVAKAF
jgi:DNA-directed RNA polymerase subunit L